MKSNCTDETVTVPNVNRFEKIVAIEINRKALDYQLILIKKEWVLVLRKLILQGQSAIYIKIKKELFYVWFLLFNTFYVLVHIHLSNLAKSNVAH